MVSGQYCVQHACDQHQPEPVRCERWAPLSYRGCFRGVPCRLCVVLYDAASCRRGPSCARGGESSLERGLTTWGARGGQGPLCAGSSRTWHPGDMCGIITYVAVLRVFVRRLGLPRSFPHSDSPLDLRTLYSIRAAQMGWDLGKRPGPGGERDR